MKPRKVSSLVGEILLQDPDAMISVVRERNRRVDVHFTSTTAYTKMRDMVELPIVSSRLMLSVANGTFKGFCSWNIDELFERRETEKKMFNLADYNGAKDNRTDVTEQEEEAARVIDGDRHIGSGAIDGYKSDASSKRWQLEAKSTVSKSTPVDLNVLDKITREARTSNKKPIVHVRFLKLPDSCVASQDWIMIESSVFELMRKAYEGS